MLFTILIPLHRNDGAPVPAAERDSILQSLWERFGGVTVEGVARGHWIDPDDGRHYEDRSLKVSVATTPDRLAEVEAVVRGIGQQLGQRAMYFETRYCDGVRFLEC